MTRIAHIITGLGGGGAERMLARIVNAKDFSAASRQVVISLIDRGVQGPVLKSAGIELHTLNMNQPLAAPWSVFRLSRLLRQLKPDIVMTWLYHADLIGTLASRLAGLDSGRLVWNIRCSDMDLSQYAFTTRLVTRGLAALSPYPAAVVTNSLAGQRAHARLGYRPKRWVHLANGFDLGEWYPDADDRLAVRRSLGLDDSVIALACVARVDPMKDHSNLLAAMEQLGARPDLCLVLIGKGTEKIKVADLPQATVIALGERRDVPWLMRGFDGLVLSSRTEGFPNVVGEAMATGVPCIVTDVGDAASIVDDTGLVVPPHDAKALASAVATFLAEPEGIRRDRSKRARERIVEHFSLERAQMQYEALWQSILPESP